MIGPTEERPLHGLSFERLLLGLERLARTLRFLPEEADKLDDELLFEYAEQIEWWMGRLPEVAEAAQGQRDQERVRARAVSRALWDQRATIEGMTNMPFPPPESFPVGFFRRASDERGGLL